MAKSKDKSLYYSYDNIRTYNKWLNFIISNRSGGKTYGAIKIGINDYLKDGSQFIYMRRYETELETKQNFFDWIIKNEEYPDYEFKIFGSNGFIKKKTENKWHILCYFIPLSTAGTRFKGGSYPLVKKIFFDEFIIKEGIVHYLKNEPFQLMEFYSTVDRDEDRVQLFALGNNISLINPYFTYFNIYIDPNKRFNLSKDKTIVVEMFTNKDLIEIKKNTRFGKTSLSTDYGAYSIDNESFLDNDNFILKRPSNKLIFVCSMKLQNKEIGFWEDKENEIIFVDYKIDQNSKSRYTLTHDDFSPDYIMINNLKNKFISTKIKDYSNIGLLYFENNEIKKLTYNALRYL